MKYFKKYQLPQDISIFAAPAPPNVNVTVEDCSQDVCAPVQSTLIAALRRFSAGVSPDPGANLAMPIEAYNIASFPQVLLLGKTPKTSTFNWVMLPTEGIETMRSRYGTQDDHEIAVNEVTSNVTLSAVAPVNITGLTLNADFTGPNFTALTWMRQFAVLAHITVPDNVARLDLAVTAPQSPIVETMRIDFDTTECREIVVLAIQANRARFVTTYGVPNVAAALCYQLPYGLTDCEAPGSGNIELVTAIAYDDTSTRIAPVLAVSTWNMPYGGRLVDAILAHKGIAAPNAQAIYQTTPAVFAIENTQPVL